MRLLTGGAEVRHTGHMHVLFDPQGRPFLLGSQMRWELEPNAFLARLSIISVSGGGGGSHFGGRAGTTPPKLSSGDRTLAGLHGVFRGKKAHTAEPRLAGKKRKPERRGRGHPIFAIEY